MVSIPRLLIAIPLVTAAAIVSACGDDDSPVTPTPPPDASTADVQTADATPLPRPTPTGRLDRAGRAAIIELVNNPDGGKDKYNTTDPTRFVNGMTLAEISSDFQRSLVELDKVDGVDDWEGGSPDPTTGPIPVDAGPDADGGFVIGAVYPHPLVSVLRNDALLVDSSKPFSETGYLDIENNMTKGTPNAHATCGGRWPGDDAVDKTVSFIIKRQLTGVSDGVGAATKPPTTTFPYLAAPN